MRPHGNQLQSRACKRPHTAPLPTMTNFTVLLRRICIIFWKPSAELELGIALQSKIVPHEVLTAPIKSENDRLAKLPNLYKNFGQELIVKATFENLVTVRRLLATSDTLAIPPEMQTHMSKGNHKRDLGCYSTSNVRARASNTFARAHFHLAIEHLPRPAIQAGQHLMPASSGGPDPSPGVPVPVAKLQYYPAKRSSPTTPRATPKADATRKQ